MPFFSNVFKSKAAIAKKNAKLNGVIPNQPQKPRWEDAWLRKDIEPEEVQELLRGCTYEIKSRGLDMPFLLLPFRPASDPSAARTFVRNYFNPSEEKGGPLVGDHLYQELRLIEPLVLCSVMKWCWSRLPGGVVTWEAYELFKIGEQDSDIARNAFATFIPISVSSDARTKIIFDFFDLLSAIAAHGKTNGMGGRKLSRLAAWWAFEHVDQHEGFAGGYKSWAYAADATSHLFFAYLRSLSPKTSQGTIVALPLSLQKLLQETEYPPKMQSSMHSQTTKVVMFVETVSPTPFALLRRAKHFEYRDDDQVLQRFSEYDDPLQALTDECRRVLKSISSANDSSTTKASTSLRDASWSRFEDIGFGVLGEESDHDDEVDGSALGRKRQQRPQGLRTMPQSKTDLGRPTTPSWADFISSGFVDDSGRNGSGPLLLPPDKILPPINVRGQSSQSHRRMMDGDSDLEPGELASINPFNLDDAFWWVWIASLAGEETTERKAVFGRCALIETNIRGGKWLVMEEIIKGAAPEPEAGAYIAEKKSIFGFSKRTRLNRSKTSARKEVPQTKPEFQTKSLPPSMSKTNFAPDQHARIQAAAAALQKKQYQELKSQDREAVSPRRARHGDAVSTKTNSVFTLQPVIMTEAAPAMKWANSYDKDAIRAKYLGDNFAGRGLGGDSTQGEVYNESTNGSIPVSPPTKLQANPHRSDSYGFPQHALTSQEQTPVKEKGKERNLPAIPYEKLQEATDPIDRAPRPMEDMKTSEPQRLVHTPSPPPVIPPKDLSAENAAAAAAATIPLPIATPSEQPRTMDRKPLPSPQPVKDEAPALDPNTFSPGPEYSQQTIVTSVTSPDSSPESKKADPRKLKKKGGAGGGFKGLFGGKKNEAPAPVPVATKYQNGAAVAAARAALEAAQKPQPKEVSPPPTKINRRFSGIGRKRVISPDGTIVAPSRAAPSMPGARGERQAVPPTKPIPVPAPPMNYQRQEFQDSQASLSRVDTNEERHAEREFRSFDQGPLEDQPAFGPDNSYPISPVEHSIEPSIHNSLTERDHQSEVEPTEHIVTDNTSEESNDLSRQISPLQDRWAQIRKNAAERAARQSEDQSKTDRTSKTDDGDDSPDETIESRVARIKARVAELTSNMEPPASRR